MPTFRPSEPIIHFYIPECFRSNKHTIISQLAKSFSLIGSHVLKSDDVQAGHQQVEKEVKIKRKLQKDIS